MQATQARDTPHVSGSLETSPVAPLAMPPSMGAHAPQRSTGADPLLEMLGPSSPRDPAPPTAWRTLLAAALLSAVADVTIFRGGGFAGYAAFFLAAPLLLLIGHFRLRLSGRALLLGFLLFAIAARLVWNGSIAAAVIGLWLLPAFAMAAAGWKKIIPHVGLFAVLLLPAGALGYFDFVETLKLPRAQRWNVNLLAVILPLVAMLLFVPIFLFANPDLLKTCLRYAEDLAVAINRWITDYMPSVGEVAFLAIASILSMGLMRPLWRRYFEDRSPAKPGTTSVTPRPIAAPPPAASGGYYVAIRNTLLCVILLFGAYLAFEFTTLWFREFPQGFYYSGYAHQGAAWLTVALALATTTLSLIFRGSLLRHPSIARLRWLAWMWSAQNILLAVAVYHRLFIYVGFNGMTRMRVVGLFGISAVVAGFLLVVWKIARQRDFVWLMRSQITVLSVAIVTFVLTPVDAIVMRYNVNRIRQGDPAPAVQISVHPIGAEGYLLLAGALDSPDQIVREGVKAMLAQRLVEGESLANRRRANGWSSRQIAEETLLDKLRERQLQWADYSVPQARQQARDRFDEYVYQWY